MLRVLIPGELIPLMGMVTGMVFMVGIALVGVKLVQGPIGQAIGRRIHGKGAADPELQVELLDLREHVALLEQRLADNEERLDFTERLLARGAPDAPRVEN
ncbi:MAG: hypothetical protein HOP28_18145 [Gemmatimonadales bacterium]|nr:hypothetical protein [Gemmatimonadales bacterium]